MKREEGRSLLEPRHLALSGIAGRVIIAALPPPDPWRLALSSIGVVVASDTTCSADDILRDADVSARVLPIGEARALIRDAFGDRITVREAEDMSSAVRTAFASASPGSTVMAFAQVDDCVSTAQVNPLTLSLTQAQSLASPGSSPPEAESLVKSNPAAPAPCLIAGPMACTSAVMCAQPRSRPRRS